MAAGLKTLTIISEKGYFEQLSKKTSYLVSKFNQVSIKYGLDMSADSEGGMFGIYFTKSKLSNINDINKTSKDTFIDFFKPYVKKWCFLCAFSYV